MRARFGAGVRDLRRWLGSVAGITGAYLLGYVFAGSEFKADVERSFYAIGHGFLIPLFFVSIGLSSDYRALAGHWTLLVALLVVRSSASWWGAAWRRWPRAWIGFAVCALAAG